MISQSSSLNMDPDKAAEARRQKIRNLEYSLFGGDQNKNVRTTLSDS